MTSKKLENIDALFIGEGIFLETENGSPRLVCNWCTPGEFLFYDLDDHTNYEWLGKAIVHMVEFHPNKETMPAI